MYTDQKTGIVFHAQVGEYIFDGFEEYSEPGMGYVARYHGPGSDHVGLYVYDLDLPSIPEGIDAAVVRSAFAAALAEVYEMWTRNVYRDLVVHPTEGLTHETPSGPVPLFLHAHVTFTLASPDAGAFTGPCMSHLFLRGLRGSLLKVRFTHATEDLDASTARFGTFFGWLVGLIELPDGRERPGSGELSPPRLQGIDERLH